MSVAIRAALSERHTMSSTAVHAPQPRVVAPERGVLGPRFGGRAPEVEIKLGAPDGLPFSVVEYRIPAGFSPPPVMHRQTREDAAVYILEGRLHYWFQEGEAFAEAGALVHLPRGGWNRWANEQDRPCRMLAIFAPAGFEQYFLDLGAVVADAGGDPAVLATEIPRLRAKYGDEEAR